jgi:hypothetical protein
MSIQAEAETFTHTSYYNSGSPLGIAGAFISLPLTMQCWVRIQTEMF